MLTSLLLIAAIWPQNVITDCKLLDDTIMVGVAKNANGDSLYCEIISQTDPKSVHIRYMKNNDVFAEKKLKYTNDFSKPSVLQKDYRSGELRQTEVSDSTVNLQYLENTHKKIGKAELPLESVDIVDAGFDNFIRDHWAELNEGKTLSVNFASIPHLRTLPLRISAQPINKCSAVQNENSPMVCFFVEVDNALLRLVLGNIKLIYDQQRRLYEFNGVVNLQSDNQDNQKAIIHYFYKTDYLATGK